MKTKPLREGKLHLNHAASIRAPPHAAAATATHYEHPVCRDFSGHWNILNQIRMLRARPGRNAFDVPKLVPKVGPRKLQCFGMSTVFNF